ncbi:uncharacterized protein LOC131841575 [Achroia grisella]|uniref:uncharacterized protein LOC131841575 n=1 Tax=Achroia grisella TaxID=688607 RepID=UPI0027D30D70|nr:uncharacterized protein LOC131841575 [Achroia grisella]
MPIEDILQGKEIESKNKVVQMSTARYPNIIPTYIVALAYQETYDDIPTAQQKICNKRSLQASFIAPFNSIAPTLSLQTLESNDNMNSLSNTEESTPETEIFIEENHCGDTENLEKVYSIPIEDNMGTNYKKLPELIFTSSKFHRRNKNITRNECNISKKVPNKYKLSFEIKKKYFKYKKPRYKNFQIKKHLYSNSMTNIVSKSRLLKNGIEKENLLYSERALLVDEINLIENDSVSLTSSPSSTRKSFFNYSSQNTLIETLNTDTCVNDTGNLEVVNSVIRLTSVDGTPYKTDVLNVSVAVTYNTQSKDQPTDVKETLLIQENLTSSPTTVHPSNALISTHSMLSQYSNESYLTITNINVHQISDKTLIGIKSSSKTNLRDDDTYVIEKTSSNFNSDTLTSNSKNIVNLDNFHGMPSPFINKAVKKLSNRPTLLDTVINMSLFPDINPSTSSAFNRTEDVNNVIKTGSQNNLSLLSLKNKGDQPNHTNMEISNNGLKITEIQKKINLTNKTDTNEIKPDHQIQNNIYCDELILNYPTNIHELWDRLVIILDLTVKRLENTLAEKTIKELIRKMPWIENLSRPIPNVNTETDKMRVEIEKSETAKEFTNKNNIITIDDSLQCDLVNNRVIDNIMLKLSTESKKSTHLIEITSKTINKIRKPELLKDFIEVFKPLIKESPAVDSSKDETITMSTEVARVESSRISRFQPVKIMFAGPVNFVRENWLVISSVPTFFVLMLCIYGVIVFLVKPW